MTLEDRDWTPEFHFNRELVLAKGYMSNWPYMRPLVEQRDERLAGLRGPSRTDGLLERFPRATTLESSFDEPS